MDTPDFNTREGETERDGEQMKRMHVEEWELSGEERKRG